MFTSLMTSRRFAPLFWCQLCSALNDNFLKNSLAMLILFGLGGAGAAAGDNAGVLITASGMVFIAPFFILSALGGELADRFDKAHVARWIRLAEIPVAGLAAAGFFWHSVPILFVALGLFGVIAALFGPLKYGILPEKLETAELSAGNALVEGATFLAILIGTIAGGIAVAEAKSPELVVAVIMALAVASWAFAHAHPGCGPGGARPRHHRQSLDIDGRAAARARLDRRLWSGAHIVSWFWLVGFVALSLLPTLVKTSLGGIEAVVTTCLAVFTVGIAIGSGLAAWASHGRPNLSLVPLGALLMGLFALVIAGSRLDFRAGAGAHRSERAPRLGPRIGPAGGAVRTCRRRWALHRAVVRGRASLGARRPAGARDRRGQRSQCRLHGGSRRHRCRPAGRGCRSGGIVCRSRPAQHCRHRRRRARLGRERAARFRPLALQLTGNLTQLRAECANGMTVLLECHTLNAEECTQT